MTDPLDAILAHLAKRISNLERSSVRFRKDGSGDPTLVWGRGSQIALDGSGGGSESDPVAMAALAAHEAEVRADNPHGLDTQLDLIDTALAGKQDLDADLTAIALLSTTTYGRALLTLANLAALHTAIGAGSANGVATLDASGKLPSAQLPLDAMEYKGAWNASTNSPSLSDGTGSKGDFYSVSTGGTQNLGSGAIVFAASDKVIHNGTIWEKVDTTDAVASVNGQTGAVSLASTDLSDTANLARLNAANTFTLAQTLSYSSGVALALASGGSIRWAADSAATLDRLTTAVIRASGSLYATSYLYANGGNAILGYDGSTAAAGRALSFLNSSAAWIAALRLVTATAGSEEVGTGTSVKMSGHGYDFRSQKGTSLADGVASSDAVNKGQLDAAVSAGGNPALAYDAESVSTASTGTLSWTHTPVGTPAGVLVLIAQNSGATDEVTGVTYGGVPMNEVPGSPVLHTTGSEDGALYGYFLSGLEIPTGAQTVAVTGSGSTKKAACYSLVGTNTQQLHLAATKSLDSGGTANPSVSLATPTGTDTFVAAVLQSSQDDVANIAPAAGYTDTNEQDFGSQTVSFIRRTALATGGAVTAGWTATSEEAGVLAVAVRARAPRDFGRVNALPTNPGIGDRCRYVVDATNGLEWEFVYDGIGAYPWKFAGGPELYAGDANQTVLLSTTSPAAISSPPSVTAPLAGEYLARGSGNLYLAAGSGIWAQLTINGSSAGGSGIGTTNVSAFVGYTVDNVVTMSAGHVATIYNYANASSNGYDYSRAVGIVPRRVG